MNHKYAPGDWIAFTGFRSVGSMNEQALLIEAIAYRTRTEHGVPGERVAYVTQSGRIVPEHTILEARSGHQT